MHLFIKNLIVVLFCATAIFSTLAQESRVEGWTVPAQAEPVAELSQEAPVQETKKVSEPPDKKVEDPLMDLKTEVSARAETLREIEEKKKKLEAYKKSLSPLEKKALKQIREQEENEQKREQRILQARRESNLSGCQNPEEVWVNDDFADMRTWRVNARVLVANVSGVPIDITVGGIPAVRNLCPGGSLTLTRSLNTWRDGNNPRIIFSAQGTLDDGRVGTAEKSVFLNVWQAQWQLSRQEAWNICLRGSRCSN